MGNCGLCKKSEDEVLMNNYMKDLSIYDTDASVLSSFVINYIKNITIEQLFFGLEGKFFKSEIYSDTNFLVTCSYMNIEEAKTLLMSIGFLCKKNAEKILAYLIEINKLGSRKYIIEYEDEIHITKKNLTEILIVYYQLVTSHILKLLGKYSKDQEEFNKRFKDTFDYTQIEEVVKEALNKEKTEINLKDFVNNNIDTCLDQEYVRRRLVDRSKIKSKMISAEDKNKII